MVGYADLRLETDEELDGLVATYVVARDEAGLDPEVGDFDEAGFTDFPYVCGDLSVSEALDVGMNVARDAAGRRAWSTYDGVGFRIFFGELEEVKEKVRRLIQVLDVVAA